MSVLSIGINVLLVSQLLSANVGLPTVGDSIILKEIRVTLLEAKRLSFEEYRVAHESELPPWSGGGLRFTFVVENVPGARVAPALGDVRVLIESQPYNSITNAMSTAPFAPLIVIRDISDFISSDDGAMLRARIPASRPMATSAVLDVFVPGVAVLIGVSGEIELEQGETHRREAKGLLRPLGPAQLGRTWTSFRFFFRLLN